MGFEDRDWSREAEEPRAFQPKLRAWGIVAGVLFATYLVQVGVQNAGYALFLKEHLALSVGGLRRFEVWQMLTCGLLHGDAGHLISNLLWLWIFGSTVEELRGGRGMVRLLVAGVFAGSVLYALVGFAGGRAGVPTVGASGGIMALLAYAALKVPHRQILIMLVLPVPIWILAVIAVGLDLLDAVEGSSRVAWEAHLGGAFLGAAWHFRPWERWRRRPRPAPARPTRPTPPPLLRERARASARRERDEAETARVDALLDRIHAEGMDSLSEEEKAFLKRVSERYKS